MKFSKPISLANLAQQYNCKFAGNPDFLATGINEIHVVEVGDITFVDHPKYYKKALESKASLVIIDQEIECPEGKHLLFAEDPFTVFKGIIENNISFIPASKFISDSATIGEGTVIQPGVFVGENVKIGKNCIIHANVSIYQDTEIADNVIIHSGTTIGADAFYVKRRAAHYEKFPSCGNVLIESDVEIGANTTIDRGVTATTVIGEGTKIDNHVHIGHDTVVGKHCIIAAHVGVSGVVRIEDFALIWGQVGIDRDLTIGKGAVILAQSGVSKTLEGGKTYFGSPASESREKMKEYAIAKRMREVLDRLDALEGKSNPRED